MPPSLEPCPGWHRATANPLITASTSAQPQGLQGDHTGKTRLGKGATAEGQQQGLDSPRGIFGQQIPSGLWRDAGDQSPSQLSRLDGQRQRGLTLRPALHRRGEPQTPRPGDTPALAGTGGTFLCTFLCVGTNQPQLSPGLPKGLWLFPKPGKPPGEEEE